MAERWETVPVRSEIRKALMDWAEWVIKDETVPAAPLYWAMAEAARQFREDALPAEGSTACGDDLDDLAAGSQEGYGRMTKLRATFEGGAELFIAGPRPESAAAELSKSDVFAALVVEILKQHGDVPETAIASALEIGFHIGQIETLRRRAAAVSV